MYLFIIIICISMSISYVHVLDLAEATKIYTAKCNTMYIIHSIQCKKWFQYLHKCLQLLVSVVSIIIIIE